MKSLLKLIFVFALLTVTYVFFQPKIGILDAWAADTEKVRQILEVKREPPKLKLEDPLPRNVFVELSKAINPAVVSITTTQNVQNLRSRFRDPIQEFFEEFYGPGFGRRDSGGRRERIQTGIGTGFIISEDGHIVTNNHVVAQGDGIIVQVGEQNKESYDATIIGRDERSDLALIKIKPKKNLPVVALGDSKDLQVGDWVAAFGNPYGHTHTMTKGIVSAIGREVKELNRFPFIQTDASINPGNSGGPLVNTKGQVIGVNSAIDARGPGIGFAIPIDNAKTVLMQLATTGKVKRAYLGVRMQPVTPEIAAMIGRENLEGVVAVHIEAGSPAAKAGLKPYDIIYELDGKKVTSPVDLVDGVSASSSNQKTKLKVLRIDQNNRAKEMSFDVVLADSPEDKKSAPLLGRKDDKAIAAPGEFGFSVADFSESRAQSLNVPPGPFQGPIVTEVARGSAAERAGIRPGDMIIDVNRRPVSSARDAIQSLKRNSVNTVRIARGDAMAIVPLGR